MLRTRMWSTIHPRIESGDMMWLMSTTQPEREFARIRQQEDGFYIGVRESDNRTWVRNDVFELMHDVFISTIGDEGKLVE